MDRQAALLDLRLSKTMAGRIGSMVGRTDRRTIRRASRSALQDVFLLSVLVPNRNGRSLVLDGPLVSLKGPLVSP